MTKIIELVVSPKGEAKIETRGFSGASCRDASRFLEQALGQQTGEQLTAEYYQPSAAQNAEQQAQR